MNWQERIRSSPDVCHGRVCIAGTRIPVAVILDNLADCVTEKDILASYPTITYDDIRAAIRHAAELASGRVILPLFNQERLIGKLWIVDDGRVRIRPDSDNDAG